MNKVKQNSFDAWGRSRNPYNWKYDMRYKEEMPMPELTTRGYTGHEHLNAFQLINMNGRLYDPITKQMSQPDIHNPNPYSTQSYNRYSYVINNPLKYTDPSGYKYVRYYYREDSGMDADGGFWTRAHYFNVWVDAVAVATISPPADTGPQHSVGKSSHGGQCGAGGSGAGDPNSPQSADKSKTDRYGNKIKAGVLGATKTVNDWTVIFKNADPTVKYAVNTKDGLVSAKNMTAANKAQNLSLAKNLNKVGNVLVVVSAVVTVIDGVYSENGWQNHHTADLFITGGLYAATFIPGVNVALWTIGGAYFFGDMASQYYTGKSLTQNIFD